MKQQMIRQKVKVFKQLYLDFVSFSFVNAALIFIWFTMDSHSIFWPKYVLIVWGASLLFKAYRLDLFPLFFSYITFLTPEWEEKKVNEMIGRKDSQRKIHLTRYRKKGN